MEALGDDKHDVKRVPLPDAARYVLRRLYAAARARVTGYGLPRFRIVRSADRLVRAALRSDVADVLGHRMRLDAHDRAELSVNGIYEPLTTDLVQTEVEAGDVVFDIGANIGYYTLLFARGVGRQGRVFAFEPEPANYRLLQENVSTNGYRNVTLSRLAVSDRQGRARLYVDPTNAGDCRIYDSRDGRASVEIETVCLDDEFDSSLARLDLIKMDVQGAEAAALRGMRGLLERHRRVKLVVEFWPYGLRLSGSDPQELLEILCGMGFSLWNLNERRGARLPTTAADVLREYPPAFENATNLYCVRT